MDLDMLTKISSVSFKVCAVLFILGAVLTALTYWKLNIRQVYLIRSGKARSKSISILEEQNRETGKLRDDIDLDFTTGGLRMPSRKLAKTMEIPREELFKAGDHTGETGVFSNEMPSEMPKEQKKLVDEADRIKESKDTSVLADVGETVQLDTAETYEYTKHIADAYRIGDDAYPQDEPKVPMTIISRELIIHTDEVIDI